MNRREFLKKSVHFALQTSVYSLLLSQGKLLLGSSEAFADPTDPRLILLKSIKGPVLLPTDSRYPNSARIFSARHNDLHPTVIALCEKESDITYSMAWAKEYNVPFRVKSGGHSYEAYSSCDGLVIDLSLMNEVTLDTTGNTVTIGAGAKLGAIYQKVAASEYAFVGGSCPFVGIGGLAQGGGFGMLSRQFGLVIDNLLSLRLITPDGNIVNVSETENPDLFWACRGGGGGNFGIATQFTFKAHPLKTVALFKVTWPAANAQAAFLAWQEWCTTLPNEVTSHFTLAGSKNGMSIAQTGGQFVGTAADMAVLMKPLLAALPAATEKTWDVSWIESVNYFAGEDKGAPELFKAKSDYMNRPWTASDVEQVIQTITHPSTPGLTLLFDHYGGAIADVDSSATAFPHRAGTIYCIQYYTGWANSADNRARTTWLQSVYESLRPLVSGSAYSNYIDADLENWAQAYYGDNLPRLISIKAKVDPNRIFDFPQAIPKPI